MKLTGVYLFYNYHEVDRRLSKGYPKLALQLARLTADNKHSGVN